MSFYTDEEIEQLGADKVIILERILNDPRFSNHEPFDLEQMTIEQLQAMVGVDEVKPVSVSQSFKIKPRKLMIEQKFHYDPETGKIHNVSGSIAGTINYSNGYLYIHTNGKSIPAHRLAWFLMKGNYPEVQIYHLNGDKLDNRWVNLGLLRDTPRKKYQARVRIGGVLKSVGYFATREECEAAKTFFKQCVKSA